MEVVLTQKSLAMTDREHVTWPKAVTRATGDGDPVVGTILDFLQRDMVDNPDSLSPLSAAWLARMKNLVGHLKVGLDEPIEGDVGL